MNEIEQILFDLSKEFLTQIVQKTNLTELEKEEIINKIASFYETSNKQEMVLPLDFMSYKSTIPIKDIPIGDIKTIIYHDKIHMIYQKELQHYHALIDDSGLISDSLIQDMDNADIRDITIYKDKIRVIYVLKDPEKWNFHYRDYSESEGWSKQRNICHYVSPVVNPDIKTVVKEDKMFMFHNLRPAEVYTLRFRICNGEHGWERDDIDVDPMLYEYVIGKYEDEVVVMWLTEDKQIKWKNIDQDTFGILPLPPNASWRLLKSPLYQATDVNQSLWFLIEDMNNETIHAKRFHMPTNKLNGAAATNYTDSLLESKIIKKNLYIFLKKKEEEQEYIAYAVFNMIDWILHKEVPNTKDISEHDLKVEYLDGRLLFMYGIDADSTKFIQISDVQPIVKIGYLLAEMLLMLRSKLQ